MVARAAQVQAGEEVGRLAGRSEHAGYAAFQGGELGGYDVVGGVLQPGIEIAAFFQVEEPAHLVRCFVFKGRTLINGYLARFSLSGVVACMDASCPDSLLLAHISFF